MLELYILSLSISKKNLHIYTLGGGEGKGGKGIVEKLCEEDIQETRERKGKMMKDLSHTGLPQYSRNILYQLQTVD